MEVAHQIVIEPTRLIPIDSWVFACSWAGLSGNGGVLGPIQPGPYQNPPWMMDLGYDGKMDETRCMLAPARLFLQAANASKPNALPMAIVSSKAELTSA